MNRYTAPLTDIRFVLYDLLSIESLYERLPGGEELSRELLDAVLDEAAKFSENILAPLNQSGDQEGCHFDNGTVRTPKGFKEAYDQFVAGGWSALTAPHQYGGQHLPESIGAVVKEMLDAANLAWANYPLLAMGPSRH